jgi:VWFA-related protein
MMRLALLVVALSISTAALAQRPADKQREHGPDQLWLDAVFVDGKGTVVTDVSREEVEVWIGHFLVPIEDFISVTPANDAGRGGRFIVLLLDDITTPLDQVPRVKEVARHIVSRMESHDHVAIVTLNGSAMESTGDRTPLLRAIDNYNVRATGVLRPDDLGAHVLQTIGALAEQLGKAGDQRKTILAIGRSDFFDRPIPPTRYGRDLKPEWMAAMRAMAQANATLYVIDSSMVGARFLPDTGDAGFAHATGGQAFIGLNDLDGAADKVLTEASNYYLIGVKAPPVGKTADLRDIQIKIKRRGVTVRTREAVSGGR